MEEKLKRIPMTKKIWLWLHFIGLNAFLLFFGIILSWIELGSTIPNLKNMWNAENPDFLLFIITGLASSLMIISIAISAIVLMFEVSFILCKSHAYFIKKDKTVFKEMIEGIYEKFI